MSIPLLLSSWIKSEASSDASEQQQEAAQAGIESQEDMFNQSLEINRPYREAGYEAVEGLQGLSDPNQRGAMLDDYYNSGEYQALEAQQTEQTLRNAAATGGIRGGNTQAGLANISPQLGQNFLRGQENRLTGLGNWGIGASSQGAQGAQQFGAQQSALLQQMGQAQAQNTLTQGGIQSGFIDDSIGSLAGLSGLGGF